MNETSLHIDNASVNDEGIYQCILVYIPKKKSFPHAIAPSLIKVVVFGMFFIFVSSSDFFHSTNLMWMSIMISTLNWLIPVSTLITVRLIVEPLLLTPLLNRVEVFVFACKENFHDVILVIPLSLQTLSLVALAFATLAYATLTFAALTFAGLAFVALVLVTLTFTTLNFAALACVTLTLSASFPSSRAIHLAFGLALYRITK